MPPARARWINLPCPEGDPLRAAALPLPPLARRGSGLLLGPLLPRLVGIDLLLPAILAAERGVAPARTSTRARERIDRQQPERRVLADSSLHEFAGVWWLPVHEDVLVPAKMPPAPEAGVEVVLSELSGVGAVAGGAAGPGRRRAPRAVGGDVA